MTFTPRQFEPSVTSCHSLTPCQSMTSPHHHVSSHLAENVTHMGSVPPAASVGEGLGHVYLCAPGSVGHVCLVTHISHTHTHVLHAHTPSLHTDPEGL